MGSKDSKKFDTDNKTIFLDVLFLRNSYEIEKEQV